VHLRHPTRQQQPHILQSHATHPSAAARADLLHYRQSTLIMSKTVHCRGLQALMPLLPHLCHFTL
jgi:hypothetical protein